MADLILVTSGLPDDRVALWEVHKDHPGGEVFVAGKAEVKVAQTPQVMKFLAEKRLVEVQVKAKAKAKDDEAK